MPTPNPAPGNLVHIQENAHFWVITPGSENPTITSIIVLIPKKKLFGQSYWSPGSVKAILIV